VETHIAAYRATHHLTTSSALRRLSLPSTTATSY
jgi:hypothetical protein